MVDKIPSQAVFFYKSIWTPETDSLMLSIITKSKNVGKWDGSVIPYDLLEQVSGVLTTDMGISFTCRDVYERFRFFEHRYRAFKMVVDTHGVSWNVNTNVVSGAGPEWENIFKRNKLCNAYYYVGDPEFPRLAQLFAPMTVKKEGHEVVIISDNTAPNDGPTMPPHQSRLPASPTMVVSESVYSPITVDTKLRRRLFDDDEPTVDGGSTQEAPPVFYVPNREGDLVPRCSKKKSTKPPKKNLKPSDSPHGSSCGSTSTSAWWMNAFK